MTIVEAAGMACVAMPGGYVLPAHRTIRDEILELLEEKSQPEDTGIGYMEFFDWLAGVTDEELTLVADTLLPEPFPNPEHTKVWALPLTPEQRENLGKRVWAAM